MSTFVALGAASVQADDVAEAVERAEYEELDWQVRHVCTEKDWWRITDKGKRPWVGRVGIVAIPALAYGAVTGNNIFWTIAAAAGIAGG